MGVATGRQATDHGRAGVRSTEPGNDIDVFGAVLFGDLLLHGIVVGVDGIADGCAAGHHIVLVRGQAIDTALGRVGHVAQDDGAVSVRGDAVEDRTQSGRPRLVEAIGRRLTVLRQQGTLARARHDHYIGLQLLDLVQRELTKLGTLGVFAVEGI